MPQERLRLLLLVRQLDQAQIQYLSNSYVIPQLRVVAEDEEADPSVDIQGPDGGPIARLTWSRQMPGDESEVSIAPWSSQRSRCRARRLRCCWGSTGVPFQGFNSVRSWPGTQPRASALTGLHNRLGLVDCLAEAELGGGPNPMALLYIDLDGSRRSTTLTATLRATASSRPFRRCSGTGTAHRPRCAHWRRRVCDYARQWRTQMASSEVFVPGLFRRSARRSCLASVSASWERASA